MKPLAMPCRVCNAAPGTACEWPGESTEFHATRASDAQLCMAVLVQIAHSEQEANLIRAGREAVSPAVIVRKAQQP